MCIQDCVELQKPFCSSPACTVLKVTDTEVALCYFLRSHCTTPLVQLCQEEE